MAELRAIVKSEDFGGGLKLFISEAILLGCSVNVEFEPRTSSGKHEFSQENTIINWALMNLESNQEINSSNLPVLDIIKKRKSGFTKGAKDSIEKLEDRGIKVNVKTENI